MGGTCGSETTKINILRVSSIFQQRLKPTSRKNRTKDGKKKKKKEDKVVVTSVGKNTFCGALFVTRLVGNVFMSSWVRSLQVRASKYIATVTAAFTS